MAEVAEAFEVSLVERMIAGDDLAMAAVYDRFGGLVHGVACGLVGAAHAADICQEVFVALWDHPERFDPARGNLAAYLVTISRRRCFDHLRRHGRRAANEARATGARPPANAGVDDAAIAHLSGERVRGALAVLPDAQRRAIELAYFDGLSFRQVAAATGTSEGTAKSRIRLGLQRLAGELRAHEELKL